MPNGTVTSCFWAVDAGTRIVDAKYELGNLRQQSLVDILQGEKAAYWMKCRHGCELGAA